MIKNLISESFKAMPESKMTMYFDLDDDVLSLGIGDSGFSTPLSAAQGGIDAILSGRTFYPPSWGYYKLRRATADYLSNELQLSYDPSELLITAGASAGLDAILRAYIDPGDELIIVSPAYSFYESLASLSGAKIVHVNTFAEDMWVLDSKALKSAITDKTKMIILNYPNNPTGAVMNKPQLEAVAEVLRETDILVVSDEIYAECVYCGRHHSIIECEGMKERTFLLSGYSKSLAMTGWRLGYIAAPVDLLKPVATISSVMTLCASGPAQEAALRGLECSRNDINYMRSEYKSRCEYVLSRLDGFGWNYTVPSGGFYIWADISRTGLDSETLCRRLISEAKVAVIFGNAYGEGYEDYIRITFTKDMQTLTLALDRIEKFLKDNKMIYHQKRHSI